MNYKLSSDTWNEKEIQAINDVIATGRYTMGAKVKEFENEFAKFFGSRNAVMTNSGSSANLITLATLKYHPKFKKVKEPNVIVPAVSWSTTFFPVHQHGFKLKFIDVGRQSFNIEPEDIEQAIDDNTVAVFAVNLLGNPCRLDRIKEICKERGVALLEDNCESLGANLRGKYCGTYGEMGTFSFFFSHHLQTMEGGMVLTDDDDLADYLRSFRAHGWIRDLSENSKLYQKSGDPFEDSFKFVLPGFCVRPLEMSGAVGLEQLKKWPDMYEMRRKNADVASKAFDFKSYISIQREYGYSSWFGFGLFLRNNLKGRRKEVIAELQKNGVECRPIVAGNFMKNPVIKYMDCIKGSKYYDNADNLDQNGFFIGNDCVDLEKEIIATSNIIEEIANK